jgi:hypothetical protein
MFIVRVFILVRPPLAKANRWLSRILSLAVAPAKPPRPDLPLLQYIFIKIVSHMIDSYYIVCKLYAPRITATGDLRAWPARIQRLVCK